MLGGTPNYKGHTGSMMSLVKVLVVNSSRRRNIKCDHLNRNWISGVKLLCANTDLEKLFYRGTRL